MRFDGVILHISNILHAMLFYVQAVYWTQNRNRKLKVTGIINDKSKVWRSSYGDGEWFSDTRPYSLEF